MFISFRNCVLLCLVVIGSTESRDLTVPECSNNATCVLLEHCEGLAFRLNCSRSGDVFELLRKLHCGFEDNKQPKICCPPYLKKLKYYSTCSPYSADEALDRDASLALLPAPGTCGVANDDRIINGEETALDEHPWLALIGYSKSSGLFSGFFCGGVLISSRYVLTAAHCLEGSDLHGLRATRVRLGEWNKLTAVDCVLDECNEPPLDVPVQQAIVHEAFSASDENLANDIALLRLQNDVPFTDFVKPICLPTSAEQRRQTYEGLSVEVAGWGKTESRSSSPVKMKVSLPVVNNTMCARIYEIVSRDITENQICAGGVGSKDSCGGDSGGPLMAQDSSMNWAVLGVVSYGPSPCGSQGWPGVYTRVTAYVDWILSKLQP